MTTSFLRSYHLSTHLNGAEHTTIEHFFNIFTRTIFFMSKDNGLPIMTGSSQDVLNCFTFYCYYPSWLYPTVVTRSNAHFWCRSRIGLWNPPQSSLLCQFFFLFFLSDLLYLAGKFVTLDRYRILSIPILPYHMMLCIFCYPICLTFFIPTRQIILVCPQDFRGLMSNFSLKKIRKLTYFWEGFSPF